MGFHAFDGRPAHCTLYEAQTGPDLPMLYGLAERWNMPVARHRRALGEGADFPGVDHYVLTYHLGGGSARRTDGRVPTAVARQGALSLQRPNSGGRFASDGVVDYGHFYFKQSLICEIADALGLGSVAEPDDFFAVFDQTWARDAEAYLRRAADGDDPPMAMEMDNRAYLIALGLLRSVRRRDDLTLQMKDTVSRPDLREVLCAIEDRIAEPLRLSDLSAIVGISPFHFARLFKDHVGEAPAQYVQRRRTERAIQMIRESRLPLAEIAFRTGFSSQSHMTRRVKAATGATPGSLRSEG